MDKKQFKAYKCFSNRQKEYLMKDGFEYICVAKDPKTNNLFWLFLRDERLSQSLENYKPSEV